MRNNLIALVCLAALALSAQAQDAKTERISQIRAAYAAAKQQIGQNGKNGKSPKDMTILVNNVIDRDAEMTECTRMEFYFSGDAGVGASAGSSPCLYFVTESWEADGHTKYQEQLFNPADGSLMFSYLKAETHAGFVVESRYYYDAQGKLVEQKHNTPNSWSDEEGEKQLAKRYKDVFRLLVRNEDVSPADNVGPGKPVTPKAQRMKHIRATYAQAKEKIAETNKSPMPCNISVTIHDMGDDWPPRTSNLQFYFDTAADKAEPGGISPGQTCYFISERRESMAFLHYGEYLFEPLANDLIFAFSQGLEEGEKREWRYYFDENGKCIEAKSEAEETDNGFSDKLAARHYIQAFRLLLQ